MDYFWIIRIILLTVILSMAVIDDLCRYMISNKIIVSGLMMALLITVAEQLVKGGAVQYIISFFVSSGVMAVVYIMKGVGAGDVKLASVCGLFLGLKGMLIMITVSFICAAVVGSAGIITGKCASLQIGNMKLHKIHFSIYLAAGCMIAVLKSIGG